jgi:hypothetical protein
MHRDQVAGSRDFYCTVEQGSGPSAATMRPRAARDCLTAATVAAKARIVQMRFANNADKLCNRVEVGRRLDLIARFRHDAVSVICSARCRLQSLAQPLEHATASPQGGA